MCFIWPLKWMRALGKTIRWELSQRSHLWLGLINFCLTYTEKGEVFNFHWECLMYSIYMALIWHVDVAFSTQFVSTVSDHDRMNVFQMWIRLRRNSTLCAVHCQRKQNNKNTLCFRRICQCFVSVKRRSEFSVQFV